MSAEPRSTPIKSRDEDTRKFLLSTSLKVFAEKGYDGATIKDLAGAANLNGSLISYYFGGKEGLFRAIIEEFGQSRLALVQKILISPTSIEDVKVKLSLWLRQVFEDNSESLKLIILISRDFDRHFDIFQDVFEQTFLKAFTTLVDFFAAAKSKKIIQKSADPLVLANIFQSFLLHTLRYDELGLKKFNKSIQDENHRKHIIDQIINITLNGVAAEAL